MKIVVDAMGGDQAPAVVVAGAVAEARARDADHPRRDGGSNTRRTG